MPYVKRLASGRINAVYDRPSREAKERVRANDPELLKFLGLAPMQSATATAPDVMVAPRPAARHRAPPEPEPDWPAEAADDDPGYDAAEDDYRYSDDYGVDAADEPPIDDEADEFAPDRRPAGRAAPTPGPPAHQVEAADAHGPVDGSALQQLDASDLEMARITEDLIDLMIAKNLINFTDFPDMAQRKLINRRALRSNMSALSNLVSDEESIF